MNLWIFCVPISVTGLGCAFPSSSDEVIGDEGVEVRIVDDKAVLSCARESK